MVGHVQLLKPALVKVVTKALIALKLFVYLVVRMVVFALEQIYVVAPLVSGLVQHVTLLYAQPVASMDHAMLQPFVLATPVGLALIVTLVSC